MAIILVHVVATAPVAAVNSGPENADPGYAGDNCTIELTELQAEIEDWATGTIDTTRLQTVIQ